ncbi:MAG: InlB B-repeat-containing protein, partial [Firmicutes bacterium]|nr:InlB B-repeat-containing protein [Candidatus Caballimonas caccae]
YSTKWKTFTVKFKVDDNDNYYSQTVKIKTTVKLDDPATSEVDGLSDPTKEGYIFAGWFDEEGKIWNKYSSVKKSLNLEAKFEAMATNVTLSLNGGTSNGELYKTMHYDESVDFLVPTKLGYDFEGWKIYGGQSNALINNGSTWLYTDSNLTLIAQWELKETVVTFDLDGGTATGSTTKTYTYSMPYNVLSNPTKIGYDFGGWYLGENIFDSGSSWDKEDRTITVKAKWIAHETTINFALNGGTVGGETTISTATYKYGSVIEQMQTPEKIGYIFGGWYYNDDKQYNVGDTWDIDQANVSLYANWIERTKNITFNANGGKITDGTTVYENSDYVMTVDYGAGVTLPIATTENSNRKLMGWFFVDELGNMTDVEWDTETTSTEGENVTLIAKWFIVKDGFVFEPDGDKMKIVGIDKNTTLATLTVPKEYVEYSANKTVSLLNGELKLYDNGTIVEGSLDTIKKVVFANDYDITNAIGSLKNLVGVEELVLPANYGSELSYLFDTIPNTLLNVYISESTSDVYSDNIIKNDTLNATIIYPFTTVPEGFDFTNAKSIRFTNITEIPDEMFKNCKNLVSVSFDKEITKVGSHAFDGCKNLTIFDATIVGGIDSYAFYNCEKLIEIDLTQVNKVGRDAFKNVKALENVNGLYIVSGWIVGVEVADILEGEIKLSEFGTIYGISDYAFVDCVNLTKIDISDTQVSYLNNTMFVGCTTGLEISGREVTLDSTPVSGVVITQQDSTTYRI